MKIHDKTENPVLGTADPELTTHNSQLATSAWAALESVPGLNAIPSVWREKMGDQFDTFSGAFLQPRPEPAAFFPCRKCRCSHAVTIYAPDDIVAVCTCEPWNCQNLTLTPADIQILERNCSHGGCSPLCFGG